MKEAMRLHAGVGYPLERLVPKGGAELCGVYLPGGTRVGINPWVVHMDKEIYGEDAAEFRPERWLKASAEKLKLMDRSFLAVRLTPKFFPLSTTESADMTQFGAGTRTCIGKWFPVFLGVEV